MGKFTLEIDLTDDTMCWGCPAKSTDNEGDWSCNITYTPLGFTELIRPKNCPLKPIPAIQPEHKCKTCKHEKHNVDLLPCCDCSVVFPTETDNWETKE